VGRFARTYRKVFAAIFFGCAAGGCTADPATDVILEADDLIARLPDAERRAAGPLDEWIRAGAAGPANDRRVALLLTAPARVTWTGRLPERAWIETAVMLTDGAGATARIGISDNRLYEGLARIELKPPADGNAAWQQPLRVDLGKYAGWQWSLFYRPSSIEWRLVFAADATPGGTIAWARPVIKRRR
jgi:hypothetical protein